LWAGAWAALGAAHALELPLSWLVYPKVAVVEPRASLALRVEGSTLVVDVDVSDPDMAGLRMARRAPDHFEGTQSYVQLFIDGAGTGKFARVFGLTPLGGILDGTLTEGAEVDTGADFRWSAQAEVHAQGWRGRMRIPLSQLQISPGRCPRSTPATSVLGTGLRSLPTATPATMGAACCVRGSPCPRWRFRHQGKRRRMWPSCSCSRVCTR
jgi:hypothetical protein